MYACCSFSTVAGGWSDWGGYGKVNGEWGGWSNWSACAINCGNGNQTRLRSRSCDNPKPSSDGKDCDGEDIELRTCTADDCKQKGNIF